MRREDQQRIVAAVQSRVAHAALASHAASKRPLEEMLAESVFHQRRRRQDLGGQRRGREEAQFWRALQDRLGRADEAEQRSLLSQLLARYAHEVCGNFNDRVYALARRVMPPLLGALLNASSPRRLLTNWLELAPLESAVILQGETEHLRRLHEVGTVILAPTHVSNLDSVILGFAILQLGLPPFIYGAARDLFDNPLLSYFLHNLGCYAVDRRNQDPLYKAVLKEYTTLTLEYGYNNLFFPGGARTRSGAMERHLKLGLVGTSVAAYVNNLKREAPRPKLFFVPVTLSYQLVLEAETLMDDFLKDVGKSRYIITDDEFSKPTRVYDFITQLFGLDSKIYVTLGRGVDPFGNPVDDNGESLDPRGRRIDCSRYVLQNGVPEAVPERDIEYTRDLGDSLAAAFSRDNVLQATHVTARVIFTLMRKASPAMDLLRLIRVGGSTDGIPLRAVYTETRRLMQQLRVLADRGVLRLSPGVLGAAEDLVSDGLRHFQIYHRRPAAVRRGDRLVPRDRALLFYYQNRLEGYDLEAAVGLGHALSADHRALESAL